MIPGIGASSGADVAQSLRAMREKMFAKADSDGSGGLSLDEFRAMGRARHAGQAAGSSQDAAGPAGPGAPPPGGPRPGGAPQEGPGGTLASGVMRVMIAVQSAVTDGTAGPATGTPDAATASTGPSQGADPMAARFAALDTNGDGNLSPAELEAGRTKAHHGHHHHRHHDGGGSAPAQPGSDLASLATQLLEALRKAMAGASGSGATATGSTVSTTA